MSAKEIGEVLRGERAWWVECADCRTSLEGLGAGLLDHIISDPPYSRDLYLRFRSNRRGGSSRHWGAAAHRDALEASAAYRAMANEEIGAADDVAGPVVTQAKRLVKRWVLLFHDAEGGEMWREPLGDWHVRCGVWVKGNPMPQITGDRPGQGFEALEIAHGPWRKRWNGGGLPAVWHHNALQGKWSERAENDHPCPKPLSLMLELVEQFTEAGDVVCDPFAGSGTTGVACIRLGRRFIGIEKSERYAALARERLEAESKGLTLRDARSGQLPLLVPLSSGAPR